MDFTLTDSQVKEVVDMHEYVREHYDLGDSYQFFKSKHSGSDKLCQKLKIHIQFDDHIDNDEIHIHNKRVLMHLSAKDKTISSKAERITQPTIRHKLIPTERITISSLLDAKAPNPITAPIKAEIGKISYR